jgi:peptidoglycan/xylan/chitin deacetylase (PgdA/CDA1 family)
MAREVIADMARLFARRYPWFMYRDRPRGQDESYIPVFVFHSVRVAEFDAKLRYLYANGYQTIGIDEVVRCMREGRRPGPKQVAITFDDGRLSQWTIAAPLLKRYGFKATAFIIAGYLEDGPPRPTLEDVGLGRTAMREIDLPEEQDKKTVMRWSEVVKLHHEGVMQIESHTELHRRVAVAGEVAGFVTPDPPTPRFDVPVMDPGDHEGYTGEHLPERYGLPLFRSEPILAVERGVAVPKALVEACRERVVKGGGMMFFEDPQWERRLRETVNRARPWQLEAIDLLEQQRWELVQSKKMLEENLRGKVVRHFCYPNSVGLDRSVALSAEAGYESNTWGLHDARKCNRPGCDPFWIGRIKHDFIYRLPGDGRKSLAEVLGGKLARRLRGERGF